MAKPRIVIGSLGLTSLIGVWTLSLTADAAEKTSGMPQLDPTTYPSQLFWLVIVFVALFWVMNRKALPLVSEILNLRANKIRQDLEAAEKLKKQAEKLQAKIQQSLDSARATANETLKSAQTEATEYNAKQAEKTNKAINSMVSEALDNISEACNQGKRDIDASAVDITQTIVDKLGGGIQVDAEAAKNAVQAVSGRR